MGSGASFDTPEKTKTLLTCLQGFVSFDDESGEPIGTKLEPFDTRFRVACGN